MALCVSDLSRGARLLQMTDSALHRSPFDPYWTSRQFSEGGVRDALGVETLREAILDLAWPQGLQEGYSEPAVLLLDEGEDTEQAANRAGYRY